MVTCEWCPEEATHEVWTANRNVKGAPGKPVGKPVPGRAIWAKVCPEHKRRFEQDDMQTRPMKTGDR